MRGRSLFIIFMLLASAFLVGTTVPPNARAATLYVGGAGPGNFTTIQAAIDALGAGGKVFVYSGLYYESLRISNSVFLAGENKDSTIVDSFKTGTVVHIAGGHAVIRDITIRNGSGYGDAGIRVDGRLDVRRSRISNSHYGIYVRHSSDCTIADNLIHGNRLYGIILEESSRNLVINNTIVDNGDGIGMGYWASENIIKENIIASNSGTGVSMGGLLGWSPYRNTVRGNTISNNSNGFYFYNAWDNAVTNNNVMNNDLQAFVRSDDRDWCVYEDWDFNYWSDCNGTDSDGDGIGETPYPIDCVDGSGIHHPWDNQDRHPRMSPIGTIAISGLELDDATLSGSHLEDVRLSWSVSPGNRSVAGFRVYRGSSYDAQGSGYRLTAFLSSGSSTFTDTRAGHGNPGIYFYRVCAVDIFDGEICATDQGAKFTRPLDRAPTLLSIPLIQSNESIERVLQTVEYDKAWCYSSREWKWSMAFKSYRRGLWNISHTNGLWVNVTGELNLTVAGTVPVQTAILLRRGWNLVGFPSFNSTYTVAELRAETGATRVEGYDPSAPPNYLRVLTDGDALQAGYGYWIHVESDTAWVVSSS